MKVFYGWILSSLLLVLGVQIPADAQVVPKDPNQQVASNVYRHSTQSTITKAVFRTEDSAPTYRKIKFFWGDVSWLPQLAAEAGWPKNTHEKLAQIVLRESGGCPNRRGGDMVNENCVITGVSEWNHRSDTGLLQINGVNYNTDRNKWAIACLEMAICTQEPLLNPLVNLQVGYLLYKNAGWGPWDPCTWGPKYAHRCKTNNP